MPYTRATGSRHADGATWRRLVVVAVIAGVAMTAGVVALNSSLRAGVGDALLDSSVAAEGRLRQPVLHLDRPTPYVALGDSFTAGPGVPPAVVGDVMCGRSESNYPHVLVERLSTLRLLDVSCSRAVSLDLERTQVHDGDSVPPQLDAVTSETRLVTLSIGGNDFGVYGRIMAACAIVPSDSERCQDSLGAGDDSLKEEAAAVEGRLTTAVSRIREIAPKAFVAVVGYPRIFPADGTTCAALPWSPPEVAWAAEVFEALNRSMAEAARRTDSLFVDVASQSDPLGVCASTPWIRGGSTSPGSAATFHPLPHGMTQTALVVQRALEGAAS